MLYEVITRIAKRSDPDERSGEFLDFLLVGNSPRSDDPLLFRSEEERIGNVRFPVLEDRTPGHLPGGFGNRNLV